MNLTNPFLKKTGIGIMTLALYGAILQTGLFARDQGNFAVNPAGVEVSDNALDDQKNADEEKKEIEVIAVVGWDKNTYVLESLDGKKYHVMDRDQQIGLGRMPKDVLYCMVTILEETDEGADVLLGQWGNGSPATKQGEQLQKELWPQIKAMKRKLGDQQWLEFHGNQPNP